MKERFIKEHYIKTDMYRCFCSARIIIAILGVCAVHLLIPEQFSEPRISVFRSFNRAWGSNAMVLVYIFTAFAYGQSFAEDAEHSYCKYAVIRGDACKYAAGKCISIFLSSVFVMTAGRLLFVMLMRCRYPWEASIGELSFLKENGCMTELLNKGHYMTYIMLHGIWQGLWAAVLSLLSALVSLYTANRLLTVAFPCMAHHLLRRAALLLSNGSYLWEPDHVFLISYNVRGNEGYSMTFAAVSGLVTAAVLSAVICRIFVRRMQNG